MSFNVIFFSNLVLGFLIFLVNFFVNLYVYINYFIFQEIIGYLSLLSFSHFFNFLLLF